MTYSSFDSRSTYLTSVAEWKAAYKQMCDTIRRSKINFKTAQRQGVPSLITIRRDDVAFFVENVKRIQISRQLMKEEAVKQYLSSRARFALEPKP